MCVVQTATGWCATSAGTVLPPSGLEWDTEFQADASVMRCSGRRLHLLAYLNIKAEAGRASSSSYPPCMKRTGGWSYLLPRSEDRWSTKEDGASPYGKAGQPWSSRLE